jgi:sugar phosphate permease
LLVRNRPQEWYRSSQTKAPNLTFDRSLNIPCVVASLRTMLRIRTLRPIFISILGLRCSQMAFLGSWSIPYLMQVYGLTKPNAASYIILINLGRILGFPLMGAISDRIGNARHPYIFGNLAYLALWFYFIVVARVKPPLTILMVIYFLLGVMGSTSVLAFTLVRQCMPSPTIGMALGFVNSFGIFGTSLFQLAVGVFLDRYWDGTVVDGVRIYPMTAYQLAFILFLVMLTCTTLSIFSIKDKGIEFTRNKCLSGPTLLSEGGTSSTSDFKTLQQK